MVTGPGHTYVKVKETTLILAVEEKKANTKFKAVLKMARNHKLGQTQKTSETANCV